MMTSSTVALALVLATLTCAQGCSKQTASSSASSGTAELRPRPKLPPSPGAPPFAVIELFTSEGCSSCPPADRVLAEIVDESKDRNVLALSFHVDYWDDLGWKDPWSNPSFSARQRSYARVFGKEGAYTPQAVIDGRVELLGSDGSRIRALIEDGLATPRGATLTLSTAGGPSPRTIAASYTLTTASSATGTIEGLQVHVALVEGGLVDRPDRGENEGETLRHENVVRAFETVSAQPSGQVVVGLPAEISRQKSSIVAYVQDGATMEIVAGARAPLP
jgi:hypothetical protein